MDDQKNKVINGLCYLSILVLPVIFPLIVCVIAKPNSSVRHNAFRACWTQLIPLILAIIFLLSCATLGLLTNNGATVGWVAMILLTIMGIAIVVSWLYNVVKGIQILVR